MLATQVSQLRYLKLKIQGEEWLKRQEDQSSRKRRTYRMKITIKKVILTHESPIGRFTAEGTGDRRQQRPLCGIKGLITSQAEDVSAQGQPDGVSSGSHPDVFQTNRTGLGDADIL